MCTILSNWGISKRPPEGMVEPGRHNKTWIKMVQAIAAKGLLNKRFITLKFLLN
jgi:hypothetical protein